MTGGVLGGYVAGHWAVLPSMFHLPSLQATSFFEGCTNIPVGRPWEMVAVDILQLPVLCLNNKYLLVIQEYFTKWAEAIPLSNHTESRITKELVQVFTRFGLPDILHSDQEPTLRAPYFARHCMDAVGLEKHTQHHTTLKEMEWIERCCRCCGHMLSTKPIVSSTFSWYSLPTAQWTTLPQDSPHFYSCMDNYPWRLMCLTFQLLTWPPTNSNCDLSWLNARTLWKRTSHKRHITRRSTTIAPRSLNVFKLVIVFGSRVLLPGS